MNKAKTPFEDKVRIDKWLWAARFYKTRQLAVKAVETGKVSLNKQSCKPASTVKEGDILAIKRGYHDMQVVVLGISEQRGPAPIAQQLYDETQASKENRDKVSQQMAAQPKIDFDVRKPDKRSVRTHRALKRGEWYYCNSAEIVLKLALRHCRHSRINFRAQLIVTGGYWELRKLINHILWRAE